MASSAVLQLTKDLLSRPSITPDDAGCQTALAERLEPLGFSAETLVFEEVTNL